MQIQHQNRNSVEKRSGILGIPEVKFKKKGLKKVKHFESLLTLSTVKHACIWTSRGSKEEK